MDLRGSGSRVCLLFAGFTPLQSVRRKGYVPATGALYFASSFRAISLTQRRSWLRVQSPAKVLFTSTLLFEKSFQG